VGNGLSVLMIDIALSRALRAVAPTGSTNIEHLAKIGGRLCEGAHLQGLDRWDTNRSAASYHTAAGMTSGAAMGLAAAIGARIAGCDATAVAAADRAGRELGLALQIADDVAVLVAGDPASGDRPGTDLREGNYTLPVIHAMSAGASELRERLRGPVAGDDVDQLIADIVGADGVRRAGDDCAVHQRAAGEILQRAGVPAGAPIMTLVGLPAVRLRAAQSQSAAWRTAVSRGAAS
jgi:geranylgeranyl pyrophosphate synthase